MENAQRSLFDEKMALLNSVSTLATQYDVVRCLKKVTDLYGMRAFLIARIPSVTTDLLQTALIISSWPTDFITRYDRASQSGASPIIGGMRTSTVPFSVDLDHPSHPPDNEMTMLFIANRMQRFSVFPVADPEGQRGAVSLYGDRPALSEMEMMELSLLSVHLFDRLYQMGRSEHRAGEGLSEREIACLNWTAAGKTSAEISDILGLSEHTVNHYLNRATRKLDTVNRTQAVAKALRTGIIN
jgi:LuxR family quorum sensing-dependent transcriptional regulator